MSNRPSSSPRTVGIGLAALLAMTIAPSVAGAQQEMSPVEIAAARSQTENARADALEETARTMYATPRKFREAAQLHKRAAMIRGIDPKAVESFRSAAWLYSAARDNGLATQMMVKAGEHAALAGRIEDAAHSYIDAALLAVADDREDKVPTILSRMHVVLSAPLLPEDRRAKILQRIESDSRVASLDPGQRAEP